MPITVSYFASLRLALATAQGRCGRDDFDRYCAALREAGAGSFGKLFDMSDARLELSASDVAAVVRQLEPVTGSSAGPTAFVVGDENARALAKALTEAGGSSGKTFEDKSEARRWLDKKLAEARR